MNGAVRDRIRNVVHFLSNFEDQNFFEIHWYTPLVVLPLSLFLGVAPISSNNLIISFVILWFISISLSMWLFRRKESVRKDGTEVKIRVRSYYPDHNGANVSARKSNYGRDSSSSFDHSTSSQCFDRTAQTVNNREFDPLGMSKFSQVSIGSDASKNTGKYSMDPVSWSNVTSPGFSSRVIFRANQSPLKNRNQGRNTIFRLSSTPHGNLPLGYVPYSPWKKLPTSPILEKFSGRASVYGSGLRSLKGSDSTENQIRIKISPIATNEGGPCYSATTSGASSIPTPQGISGTGTAKPPSSEDGLGGTSKKELVNAYNRMWTGSSPNECSSPGYTGHPATPSPGHSATGNIIDILSKRKRPREQEATTTENWSKDSNVGSLSANFLPGTSQESKRMKYLNVGNESIDYPPMSLPSSAENMMTSESILEQMNQTEKRFLPDDESVSDKMVKKSRLMTSSSAPPVPTEVPPPRSGPVLGKRRANFITVVDEDPREKNAKFCTCNECYEDAGGLLRLDNSKPGMSKTLATPTTVASNNSKVSLSNSLDKETEADIEPKVILVRYADGSNNAAVTSGNFEKDKKKRFDRFFSLLGLPTESEKAKADVVDGVPSSQSKPDGNEKPSSVPLVPVSGAVPSVSLPSSAASNDADSPAPLGLKSTSVSTAETTQPAKVADPVNAPAKTASTSIFGYDLTKSPTPTKTNDLSSAATVTTDSSTKLQSKASSTPSFGFKPPTFGSDTVGTGSSKSSDAPVNPVGGFSFGNATTDASKSSQSNSKTTFELSKFTAATTTTAANPATTGFSFGSITSNTNTSAPVTTSASVLTNVSSATSTVEATATKPSVSSSSSGGVSTTHASSASLPSAEKGGFIFSGTNSGSLSTSSSTPAKGPEASKTTDSPFKFGLTAAATSASNSGSGFFSTAKTETSTSFINPLPSTATPSAATTTSSVTFGIPATSQNKEFSFGASNPQFGSNLSSSASGLKSNVSGGNFIFGNSAAKNDNKPLQTSSEVFGNLHSAVSKSTDATAAKGGFSFGSSSTGISSTPTFGSSIGPLSSQDKHSGAFMFRQTQATPTVGSTITTTSGSMFSMGAKSDALAPTTGGFSFGSAPSQPQATLFGGPAATTTSTATALPVLFGSSQASSSNSTGGFSFGQMSTPATKPSVFGQQPVSSTPQMPQQGFGFGGSSNMSTSSPTPFSFGGAQGSSVSAPSGAPPASSVPFAFGAGASSKPNNNAVAAPSAAPNSAFSFGSAPSSSPGVFQFGQSPSSTAAPSFNFGGASQMPQFGASAPTGAPAGGAGMFNLGTSTPRRNIRTARRHR